MKPPSLPPRDGFFAAIGMVGAQKTLPELPTHITGLLNHLRTRMEHQLALDIPRLSEMIAFRKVFDAIPVNTAVDEAFVEALVVQHGLDLRYAPDAIVYLAGAVIYIEKEHE